LIEQAVPYDIRELPGFQKRSPGTSGCAWRHMGRFLEYDRGRSIAKKKFYPEPHHPRVSLMDLQKDLGRIRETKITNMELNWLYSASIARQPIDPTHLMINRWCCEQHRIREIFVRGVTSPCWLSL
jgi:hypothetical protein